MAWVVVVTDGSGALHVVKRLLLPEMVVVAVVMVSSLGCEAADATSVRWQNRGVAESKGRGPNGDRPACTEHSEREPGRSATRKGGPKLRDLAG